MYTESVDDEDEMDGWAQKESDEEDGSTMPLSQLTPQNVFTDSPTWPHSFLLNMLHPDLEGFTPREELSSDAKSEWKEIPVPVSRDGFVQNR
jgi:hypothetical protein